MISLKDIKKMNRDYVEIEKLRASNKSLVKFAKELIEENNLLAEENNRLIAKEMRHGIQNQMAK